MDSLLEALYLSVLSFVLHQSVSLPCCLQVVAHNDSPPTHAACTNQKVKTFFFLMEGQKHTLPRT